MQATLHGNRFVQGCEESADLLGIDAFLYRGVRERRGDVAFVSVEAELRQGTNDRSAIGKAGNTRRRRAGNRQERQLTRQKCQLGQVIFFAVDEVTAGTVFFVLTLGAQTPTQRYTEPRARQDLSRSKARSPLFGSLDL